MYKDDPSDPVGSEHTNEYAIHHTATPQNTRFLRAAASQREKVTSASIFETHLSYSH